MDWIRYRFHHVWHVDAPGDLVYQALEDIGRRPLWWREFRRCTETESGSWQVTIRSWLPIDVVLGARWTRRDPGHRVLEAETSGDLVGHTRWTIVETAGSTEVTYDEEVVTTKPLMRWLAPVARPAFRANHGLMMRHGERGLRALVAGGTRARRPSGI
jgi:Polyketide cyclase / dehydrase and lipid transport